MVLIDADPPLRAGELRRRSTVSATTRQPRKAETMRILIADDHPLILVGVREALETGKGFEVVAEARSGPEVLPLVNRTKPDVVLLDLRMPGIDGLGCLDRIVANHPGAKVVIFSASADPGRIESAFGHGAAGYIVKGVTGVDLPSAIRLAVAGEAYHAQGLPGSSDLGLTDRELTIVKAVARGLSNHEIGRTLWVTERTIKFHLTNIYRKLGVRNRTGAARWVLDHALLDDSDGNVAVCGAP
jgi:DNA-binding NarL/FixJ family response regulator